MSHLFLPTIWIAGARLRTRVRWCRLRFGKRVQSFNQGTVATVWLGLFYAVVMIDRP